MNLIGRNSFSSLLLFAVMLPLWSHSPAAFAAEPVTAVEESVPSADSPLKGVLILPNTRTKSLTLRLELQGIRRAETLAVTAEALDEKGTVEKTFTGSVNVQARPEQSVPVTFKWANPRLWDLGRPNLYTLRMTLKSAGNGGESGGVNESYTTRFGFREIWTEDRKIMLNGHEVRFRPINFGWGPGWQGTEGEMKGRLKELMAQGFNLAEVWPGEADYHATNKALAEAADELGFAIAAAAPFIRHDDGKAAYLKKLEEQIGDLRNHPSILLWGTSGNAYLNANDQHPQLLGKRHWSHVQEIVIRNRLGREYLDVLKTYDPTRPTFTHAGNEVGDLYTLNNYLAMLPLQEREDWLSDWARTGRMPLFMVEFGTPLFTSYLRGRTHYGEAIVTEPFSTEWAAAYLGDGAYGLESEAYRRAIGAKFKEGQHYEAWRNEKAMLQDPAFKAHQELFITNTWRAWRTWGISGGMIPWEDANGHLELLKRVNGPTIAWIAGPRNNFTSKDHHVRPGQRVEKSAVLINDRRTPQPFELRWEATMGGKQLAGQSLKGTLGVSETRFVPLRLTVPKTAVNGNQIVIRMTADIGGERHQDGFDLRAVTPPPPSRGELIVFDPSGETTAMLKALGYSVRPLNAASSEIPKGTIVVGREALSGKDTISRLGYLPFDVPAFVHGGGRLVVFGQDPRWLPHALGLRVAHTWTRRVFPTSASRAVMDGLFAPGALMHWAGSSGLTRATPEVGGVEPWFTPAYGWHWGNRGVVSSAPVEKPHRSSWRPLFETEFDLAYTPLMEMEYGNGRVILCTLDLEDHYRADPAAHRLAANLMRYAVTAPVTPKAQRVHYVGGDEGARLLDFMGVHYHRSAGVPNDADLVLAGPGADLKALEAWAEPGRNVLVLPRASDEAGITRRTAKEFAGSRDVPDWPEARGLSVSDLRWRSLGEATLIAAGPAGLEIGADGLLARRKVGKGVILYTQIDPTALPADEKTYLRFTRWRQTRALAQVLSNLGATFKQDLRQLQLIQNPAHALFLSGTWDAVFTRTFPESPTRDPKHPFQPLSDAEKALVSLNPPKTDWQKVNVPAYMESYGKGWIDGGMVFRKTVELPSYFAGKDLVWSIGRVDENEISFFNGEEVGRSHDWLKPRAHTVPGRLVKAGPNVLALRSWDQETHGGWSGEPIDIHLRLKTGPNDFYHPDYLPARDFERGELWPLADDPYRYFRW